MIDFPPMQSDTAFWAKDPSKTSDDVPTSASALSKIWFWCCSSRLAPPIELSNVLRNPFDYEQTRPEFKRRRCMILSERYGTKCSKSLSLAHILKVKHYLKLHNLEDRPNS